jgi:hypothetical protein
VKVSPRARFSAIEMIRATPAITRIWLVSLSSWRVSGVLTAGAPCSMPEMWPTLVAIPVAVTTNAPEPARPVPLGPRPYLRQVEAALLVHLLSPEYTVSAQGVPDGLAERRRRGRRRRR